MVQKKYKKQAESSLFLGCFRAYIDSENSSLILDGSERTEMCIAIESWEKGMRWQYRSADGTDATMTHDPAIPLLSMTPFLGAKRQADKAVKEWIETIPETVRNAASRFYWRQIPLLYLARNYPPVQQLLKSDPLLLWLTVDYITEHNDLISNDGALFSMKRAQLIGRLFPNITWLKAAAKLLRQFSLAHFTEERLRTIKLLVENEAAVKALRHCSSIDGAFLDAVYKYEGIFNYPFIHDVVEKCSDKKRPAELKRSLVMHAAHNVRQCREAEQFFSWTGKEWQFTYAVTLDKLESLKERLVRRMGLVKDIRRMTRELNRDIPAKEELCNLPHKQLQQIHDEYQLEMAVMETPRYLDRLKKKHGTTDFPAPPVLGTDQIIPITNAEELFAEGKVMNHCVAGYAANIFEQKSYIYRMISPQRLTIELVKKKKRWELGQVSAKNNHSPKQSASNEIAAWLKKNALSEYLELDV